MHRIIKKRKELLILSNSKTPMTGKYSVKSNYDSNSKPNITPFAMSSAATTDTTPTIAKGKVS